MFCKCLLVIVYTPQSSASRAIFSLSNVVVEWYGCKIVSICTLLIYSKSWAIHCESNSISIDTPESCYEWHDELTGWSDSSFANGGWVPFPFFGGFNTSYQKDQIFSSMHHWPTKLSVSHLTAEKWVPSRKSLVESPYASFRLTFLQNTSGLVWYLHKFARTVILTVAAYGTKTIADQHSITIECVGMPNHP